ncbi:hypothetical protein GCM10027299_35800 [Larkinella ripae]
MPTPSPLKTILLAGLVAGTLDITAAITILGRMNATAVLRYVASGVFGKTAFTAGPEMIWYGLLFHYLIAFSFTLFYYLIFPALPLFRKHKYLSGLLYGGFVWGMMNLVIVPLTNVSRAPLTLESALLNLVILMVCIGLPIALIVHRYFSAKR